MATGLVYSPLFLAHRPVGYHPENEERLSRSVAHLQGAGLWERVRHLEIAPADEASLARLHTPEHIDRVRRIAGAGGGHSDPDTYLSGESFAAASLAAGGACAAVEAVLGGEVENAFCLVRPPGHHARPAGPMGFCLFNNLALAARHLQEEFGLERILVFDFDLHHGNGVQDAFYRDPGVFYISLHKFPFFPGTGAAGERGDGRGRAFTLNIPLGWRISAEEYMEHFGAALRRARDYRPQFVLLAAGFDAYTFDPIGNYCLEEHHYREITRRLRELATESCGGRLVSTLEGGYHPTHLPRLITAHLEELL